MFSLQLRLPLLLSVSAIVLLSSCDAGRQLATTPENGLTPWRAADAQATDCVLADERRQVGDGLDATGRLKDDSPAVLPITGACADNTAFQFGAGRHDITGVIADTASLAWVNPQQVFSALHSRVYARAFALQSACNNQRILFVSIDTGLMSASIRQAVLGEIAADPQLAALYDARNVMLSVTHTHSDPGTGLAGIGNGFAVIAGGIVAAIRDAQANLQAHPQAGHIRLSSGELLNTNINRSKPAYAQNSEQERASFLNARGEETQVNKRMVQLELYRADDTPVGLMNWFGVHPTVIGPAQKYVSGDVKGTASLGFEALMQTRYGNPPTTDTFIAAFAQADEGDSSPNIAIEQYPYPDVRRGGGSDELDSNGISALKQMARAVELYGSGEVLRGPIDFRYMMVDIDNITIEDPAVLASMQHPAELDEPVKRTCTGILGASFGAGAEDGPGPASEGLTCSDTPDVLNLALADIETLAGKPHEGFPGGWPTNTIPGHVLTAATMCNVDELPPILGDFSCQAEKPVLLPRGSSSLPLQLFRMGQFALVGVPWEVTTTSARRLRKALLEELAPVGVDTIVIAGLVNDYVHYLTTREEYAVQHYEGASTLYGPWTLAAVTQATLKLARDLRSGTPSEAPATAAQADLSFVPGPNELPHPLGAAGTEITPPPASIKAGETLRAEYVAGHPGNDLQLQGSYVTVERMQSDGSWQIAQEDRSPDLLYIWKPLVPVPLALERPPLSSGGSAEIVWNIPRNTTSGTYRLQIRGASKGLLDADATPYAITSKEFQIEGSGALCP